MPQIKKSCDVKPYEQQVHKDCGGTIVLVARSKSDWGLACHECKSLWNLPSYPFKIVIDGSFKSAFDTTASTVGAAPVAQVK